MQVPKSTTLEAIYTIHRDYLQHEDHLMNHRTTWLITIQSFLIATFGFTYQKRYEVAEKLFSGKEKLSLSALGPTTDEYQYFMFALCLVGIVVSVMAYYSIDAAARAISGLRAHWDKVAEGNVVSHLPALTGGGDPVAESRGFQMPHALPIFFALLWLFATLALVARFSMSMR